jgi:hypothetical protein
MPATDTSLTKDITLWGLALWLAGYLLGFIFYALVPTSAIGWCVMPFGILMTCWVLRTRIGAQPIGYAALLGLGWALIAIAGDYLFLVKLLDPPDGYYKLDVFLYYAVTFLLPIGASLLEQRRRG